MNADEALRKQLLALLEGHQAHMTFEDATANFPPELMNVKPPNVEYTPYHLVEHLRLTQWDILDYIRNPNYKEMSWPEGYWSPRDAVADAAVWQRSIDQFLNDRHAIADIVRDPKTDLHATIPYGYGGHTILREVLVVADHNAYHIGELGILRQVMGAWGKR
jgi:hypothetical protein